MTAAIHGDEAMLQGLLSTSYLTTYISHDYDRVGNIVTAASSRGFDVCVELLLTALLQAPILKSSYPWTILPFLGEALGAAVNSDSPSCVAIIMKHLKTRTTMFSSSLSYGTNFSAITACAVALALQQGKHQCLQALLLGTPDPRQYAYALRQAEEKQDQRAVDIFVASLVGQELEGINDGDST
jgi:hypothetical protein